MVPAGIQAQQYVISSPDQKISAKITVGENVYCAITCEGRFVLMPSPVSMTVNGNRLGYRARVKASQTREVNTMVSAVYGVRAQIPDHYRELKLDFEGNYSLLFRVYDKGVAWRFQTGFKGKVIVNGEESEFRFDGWPEGWFSEGNSYETLYTLKKIAELDLQKNYFLPCIINTTSGVKLAIVESDVDDYPCMHIRKSPGFNVNLQPAFDYYPLQFKQGGFNNYILEVTQRAGYIAYTDGTRSFPWRVCIVAPRDEVLADCDLVYLLARPQAIQETDWIKPGQVMWDWWANYVLEGVDFKSGINTPTYLYHIDFADKWNIPYILVDWKWSDGQDLLLINPEVDVRRVCAYGRQKGVGVILWAPSFTLDRQLDRVLDSMAAWGAIGVKVDFFDRWDQLANQMYERIARACARRKMIVDFHGCYLPCGLHRTYPNIINYEGVLGNEVNKWDKKVTPEHKVTLPFTRMLGGPMDFTPGGMRNAVGDNFVVRNTLPFTNGTRCMEMALYVVYQEPLVMLSDAATEYAKEPELFRFITHIPSSWDESKVLEARMSDYLIVARKKGNEWYIGGINDETMEREFTVPLSFLDAGKQYVAHLYTDGVNTDKIGTDYRYTTREVSSSSSLSLKMNRGGGCIVRIVPR